MEIEEFKINWVSLMNVFIFGGFDVDNRKFYVMNEYIEVFLMLNVKFIIFFISFLLIEFIKEYI